MPKEYVTFIGRKTFYFHLQSILEEKHADFPLGLSFNIKSHHLFLFSQPHLVKYNKYIVLLL